MTVDIWRDSATKYGKGAPHRPVHGIVPSTCTACHGLIGWTAASDPVHAVPEACRICGRVLPPFTYRCEPCRTIELGLRQAEVLERMGKAPAPVVTDAAEDTMAPDEVDAHRGQASPEYREARAYVVAYTGSFDFLRSMHDRVTGPRGVRGPLSERMVAAILKCKASNEARVKAREVAVKARVQTGRDLSVLPVGRTAAAVENESGGLTFLLIDRPAAASKWTGWAFVKQQQGPNEIRLGSQRPGESYVGQWPILIDKVIADPVAAVARYGRELGVCGVCMKALTNEESRELGIGPVCRARIAA